MASVPVEVLVLVLVLVAVEVLVLVLVAVEVLVLVLVEVSKLVLVEVELEVEVLVSAEVDVEVDVLVSMEEDVEVDVEVGRLVEVVVEVDVDVDVSTFPATARSHTKTRVLEQRCERSSSLAVTMTTQPPIVPGWPETKGSDGNGVLPSAYPNTPLDKMPSTRITVIGATAWA